MSDLGSAMGGNSTAYDINNAGIVVGQMGNSDFSAWHAFVYQDGVMTDLAPFLLSIGLTGNSGAMAVSDSGQIVGYGTSTKGESRAFLVVVVPEPATPALIVLAAASLLLPIRRLGKSNRSAQPLTPVLSNRPQKSRNSTSSLV